MFECVSYSTMLQIFWHTMSSYLDEEDAPEDDVPQAIAELAQASVPDHIRNIRACKRCGILKTFDQFMNDGCENCPFLDMVS